MKVIDEILLEWSYRCPDGIVDMNDPNKIKILSEILKPLITEDIDDEILNVLTSIDNSETKEKVLKYLQKINKKEDKVEDEIEKDITKILKDKNLGDALIDLIIAYANKTNQLNELLDYLKNPIVNHSDLLNKNNLNTLFEPVPLSDIFKNKIINLSGASGNVSYGKGEIALVLFIKNAVKFKSPKKEKDEETKQKGDIGIDGYVIEVKRGISILSTPKYISRISKSEIVDRIKKFVSDVDFPKGESWTSQLINIGLDEKVVKDIINSLYPGLSININTESAEALNTSIGLALAKEYLEEAKKDLLFINENNDYVCIEKYSDFESAVNNKTIQFNPAADLIPRAKYTK